MNRPAGIVAAVVAAVGVAIFLACFAGCAPTLADLRSDAADLNRDDALHLAAEAWDAWHTAELIRDPSPAHVDHLEALDRQWGDLYAGAVHASREDWRRALGRLLAFLHDVGAL